MTTHAGKPAGAGGEPAAPAGVSGSPGRGSPIYGSHTSLRRYVVRSGMWVTFGMGLNAIATLGNNALLARMLDPSSLGAYFVLLSLVTAGTRVAQLGMDRGTLRTVGEALTHGDDARLRAAVRAVIELGLLGALVVALAWLLGAADPLVKRLLPSWNVSVFAGALSVWLIAYTMKGLIAETFRAMHMVGRATLYSGLAASSLCLAAFSFMRVTESTVSLEQIVWVTTVATAAMAIVALWQLAKTTNFGAARTGDAARTVLVISLPLLVSGLATMIRSELHVWMLTGLESERVTAVYGAVLRLVVLASTSVLLLRRIVMPSLVALHWSGDRARLQELLNVAGSAGALPAFVVIAVFTVFGHQVLGLLYGDYYAAHGALALAIMSAGLFVNVITGFAGVLLMMTGHERHVMWAAVSTGVFSLLVTYVCVARLGWGVNGAAAGFAVGLGLNDIVTWLIAWRVLGLRTHFRPDAAWRGVRLLAKELRLRRAPT